MNEYQKRFVALLKTIFELDKSDLDFGIYRIINIRQREIVELLRESSTQENTRDSRPICK